MGLNNHILRVIRLQGICWVRLLELSSSYKSWWVFGWNCVTIFWLPKGFLVLLCDFSVLFRNSEIVDIAFWKLVIIIIMRSSSIEKSTKKIAKKVYHFYQIFIKHSNSQYKQHILAYNTLYIIYESLLSS